MECRKVLALRGPNVWAPTPVLEVWIDLGRSRGIGRAHAETFRQRLAQELPAMSQHAARGTAERPDHASLAHYFELVLVELQRQAGTPVAFSETQETCEGDVYRVAVGYCEESVVRACLATALELCSAACAGQPFDVEPEIRRLKDFADRACLGPSTMAILRAAHARGIPTRRLNTGSLVQLGHGAKQRRIWTAETDRTSAIAESIAQDKELSKNLLAAAGVPVPNGRAVTSADDACLAAREINRPVVVKPLDANHGRGVFAGLTEPDRIRVAYDDALKEGSGVLVERFVRGFEHRLLVVGDRLIAASKGDAIYVTGDGQHSIEELIELQVNSDPRRGEWETQPLDTLVITPVVLSELDQQGCNPQSVPANGVKVLIKRNDNLTTDVTDDVHPANVEHALAAARVVGLDVAGIDVVAENIAEPLEDQGGAIVEVNAGPGMLMHLQPLVGKPRPCGEAIVDLLFAPDDNGRIPIVAVAGATSRAAVARLVWRMLQRAARVSALATTEGMWVGDRCISRRDSAKAAAARDVLTNPYAEAAVLETTSESILQEGLGYDRCDVAVVCDLSGTSETGRTAAESPDLATIVERTVLPTLAPAGIVVLPAADPLAARLAQSAGRSTIYFAKQPTFPVLVRHAEQQGRAVLVRNGQIVLATGAAHTPLMDTANIKVAAGAAPLPIEQVLAAIAAAWALGVVPDCIAETLVA